MSAQPRIIGVAMGWKDRDYARKGPYPDDGWTVAVKWLVIANVLAYFVAFFGTHMSNGWAIARVYELFALVPSRAFGGHQFWQLLTYAFVHDLQNPLLLGLNMYMLWLGGRELEFIFGPFRFLRFYFAAVLFSGLVYAAGTLFRPEAANLPLLGSAGAAMAVLVVYACYHPGDRFPLFFLIDVPIWLGVVVLIAVDLAAVGHLHEGGSLAAGSYLAGAGFGFAVHHLRTRIEDWVERVGSTANGPRLKEKLSAHPSRDGLEEGLKGGLKDNIEVELDLVLKKVHEQGMASLSPEEKSVLDRASAHYRSKR
jgi:membrane associated rhomboid family serine protease